MSSSALTLGRAKGSVLLGQALRLTVPVQIEMGEGASALCFEADVFYGDTRQDASRVSVSSELLPQSQSANITVTAQAAVDEPVVTVYLRAVCESKTTRRYVLLSELASTAAPSINTLNLPSVSPALRPAPVDQPPSADMAVSNGLRTAKRVKAASLDAKPGPTSDVKPVPKLSKLEGRRAHLQLTPLDLTQEREPALRLSNELVVEGGEDPEKRARAMALWQSLNATPQEILSAESHRQALESELKGLHDITLKNRQVLDELTRRLGNAESEHYFNPLVYGLLAVILLSGLVIVFVWNRMPRGVIAGAAPWWRGNTTGDRSETVEFGEDDLPQPTDASTQNSQKMDMQPIAVTGGPSAKGLAHVDIDLHLDDSGRDDKAERSETPRRLPDVAPRKPASRASGHMDFAHSMSATLRSVNTKEMLDVRQQAEFFMTLGQHEEAIALLKESVDASADANPLVALELLKVLHTLGRKGEYDHYSSGFNAIFSGHVPAYPGFNQSGSGLEAYPEVCRHIVARWPEEEAVSYIEHCLVRSGKENDRQDFDLEAFRDLLMLHGVASRIASSSFDSGFMAFSAAKIAPKPISPMAAASDAVVDFDLSESRSANLIDFDASGWSPPTPDSDKGKPL